MANETPNFEEIKCKLPQYYKQNTVRDFTEVSDLRNADILDPCEIIGSQLLKEIEEVPDRNGQTFGTNKNS